MFKDPKKRKWFLVVASIILSTLLLGHFLSQIDLKAFFIDYGVYLNSDIEHQVSLFERIVGGICTGATTFIALLITIRHENHKNQETWEKEKKQEAERRLWSVKPILNLESRAVSNLRTSQIDSGEIVISLGNGNQHLYVTLIIKNVGNGECRDIKLMNSNYEINQIDKSDQKELKLFFSGLPNNLRKQAVNLVFQYVDIYGTSYTQAFKCSLDIQNRFFNIKMQNS